MLKLCIYNKKDSVHDLFPNRETNYDANIETLVKDILENVKKNGDIAVREYTNKFDKVDLENFLVSKDALREYSQDVAKEFYAAMLKAKENIEKFHKSQVQNSYINFEDNGVCLGQRVVPIERVGIYVPGGTAAYPSSVLMNAIPAKVAGVKEIIMVTPPSKDGKIRPEIALAAIISGVDKVYNIGGAQAVAALAYGTVQIKKVDKIVGPGNIYVATAKKLVYGEVDIDMVAGPSEILVIADENANPKYIAADLLSQAEHDVLAASVLVTNSVALYKKVNSEIKKQMEGLERKNIIISSIKNYGKAIICEDIEEAIYIANIFAPEHLEIMVEDAMSYLPKVKNAASVFLGYNTPEPVGDYFAGVNHVLPTNRTSRFFSPLSVDTFVKKISFTKYTKKALLHSASDIMVLARNEGLTAHENSIKVRLED